MVRCPLADPKPLPESKQDQALWREAERRQSLLDGQWGGLAEEALGAFYAPEVVARFSTVDTSRNPAAYAWRTLNTLYDDTPTVTGAPPEPLRAISTPELWALRQDAQLRALAIGESLMRIDVDGPEGAPEIRYRVVGAECVELEPDPDRPGRPRRVRETRQRRVGGAMVWTRETWAPDAVVEGRGGYSVEAWQQVEGGTDYAWRDVTPTVLPEGGYPYADDAGPILPYVLVHSEVHGTLRQPDRWRELISATMSTACLSTFWLHGVRDAAHPQPVMIDATPTSGVVDAVPGSVPQVVLRRDPSSVWMLRSIEGRTGSITSITSSMDPMGTLEAIDAHVAGALRDAGLGPTDEAPAKGVSGVAISVSREALRRSQRQQRPAAESADRQILAIAARLARAYGVPGAAGLPTSESAYSIEYHGIAPSTEETRAIAERQRILIELGLTEPWRAIAEVHPHLTDAEAMAMADRIAATRGAPMPTAPAAPPAPPAEAEAEPEIDADEAAAVLAAALAVDGMPEQARALLAQLAGLLGAD